MMRSATVTINGISDEGQPNQNTWSDSASDTYVYNGDGQRVKKVEDGITTKYYYSGSVVLFTADEDNNKVTGQHPRARRRDRRVKRLQAWGRRIEVVLLPL